MRATLTHARDMVRDLGVRRSLRVAPRWLIARDFHVLATRVDTRLELPAPREARCDVLGETDLAAFVRACPEVSVREARRRWRLDHVCLVCWIGREVAAYRWSAAEAAYLPYLGRVLRGAPGDIVIIEARTLPDHRRAGAGLLLAQAELQYARRHGARRVVGLIAAWNHPSLAWAETAGWIYLGAVGYRRAGWRRQYFVAGAVRLDGEEVVVLPEEGLSPP